MHIYLYVKYKLFLQVICFSTKSSNIIFVKIHALEAEFFHADKQVIRQTDIANLIVAF